MSSELFEHHQRCEVLGCVTEKSLRIPKRKVLLVIRFSPSFLFRKGFLYLIAMASLTGRLMALFSTDRTFMCRLMLWPFPAVLENGRSITGLEFFDPGALSFGIFHPKHYAWCTDTNTLYCLLKQLTNLFLPGYDRPCQWCSHFLGFWSASSSSLYSSWRSHEHSSFENCVTSP